MFKEKLMKFLALNGVTQQPETERPSIVPMDGFHPADRLAWFRGSFKLALSMDLVPETEAGALGVLEELQKFFGVPVEVAVSWSAMDQPGCQPKLTISPIGKPVPSDLVSAAPFLDQSKAYYFNTGPYPEVGTRYVAPDGEYVAVSFGMFSRWWMKK